MSIPISKPVWKRLEAVKTVSKTVSNILPKGSWKRFPSSKMGPFPISTAEGRVGNCRGVRVGGRPRRKGRMSEVFTGVSEVLTPPGVV